MNPASPSSHIEAESGYHLPSVLQFTFSILAVILLLMGALLFGLMGFLQRSDSLYNPVAEMQWAASFSLGAILVLPSIYYSFRRLRGASRTQPSLGEVRLNWVLFSTLLLLTMPAVILLGNFISLNDDLAWILLPPLHLLAIVLPIFWLVSLALRGLSPGSPQRAWGVFDVGLVLGPGLILILELAAMLIVGILIFGYVVSQPELFEELTNLAQRLSVAPPDPELVLRILEPYLTGPIFLFLALGFASVLIPIIEELLKPIGVWFLSGSRISPAEGFAAGVLSGAGYALFENLALSSGGADWALAVTTRAGTAVIHICTTALMGWALTLAWTKREYIKLIATFLFVVFIHGLWNGLALFGVSTNPFVDFQSIPTSTSGVAGFAVIGLIAIIIILFFLLMLFNRRLRKASVGEENYENGSLDDDQEEPPLVM